MKCFIRYMLLIVTVVFFFGCVQSATENEKATNTTEGDEVHVANWMAIHKIDALADLNSCQNCHGFNFDGGSVDLSCRTCHPNASNASRDFSDFHDTKVQLAPSCSECHSATGATVNPNDAKVHDSCTTTCHDANYQLITPPPAKAPLLNATGGDCTACHDAYFDNHTHGTGSIHDVLMRATTDLSAGFACNFCHSSFVNDWTGILALHTGGCGQCHSSTRSTFVSTSYTTVKNVISVGVTVGCLDCHTDRNMAHGTNHVVNGFITGTANCTSCHGLGTNFDSNYINTIHGTCDKCHVSASGGGPLHDYSVTGGNIGDTINYEAVNGGGGGSCADCHVRYNTNFETGHQHEDHSELTDSVSCTTNCHIVNVSILADIHGDTTGCTNCHTDPVTDGTLIVGINHHGSAADHVIGVPSACTDCHGGIYSYDTDFKAHAVKDHTGVAISANCTTTCHTVNIPVEADIILSTHKNVCTNCHFNTTTDGRLKAGTNGTAVTGSGTCAFCHPDYNSNFLTGHDSPDHRNANNTTDMLVVSVAGNCTTTCHNGSSLNAILVNIHGNGTISTCTKCHTNTLTDGTLRGGTNGTADGHLLDTQSTCASCHSAYNTNFSDSTNGHKNDTHVAQLTGNVTCVSTICHPGVIIDVVHKLDCTNCHVDPTTNGTLKSGVNGSAAGHTVGGSSACTDCHGGVYTYDTNFAIHDVQDHTGIAKSTNCTTTCHTVTSITIINIAAEIISSTHKGTCANCHNNTANNGTLKAGADGTALLGAGNCAFCHSAYNTDYTTHNVGDHSGVIANASPVGKRDDCTTACHTGDRISEGFGGVNPPGTHKNNCFHCHTNGATNGTLIDGVNNYGDASGHSITTASDCNACHVADGYFDSHTHIHTVSINPATDQSQNTSTVCSTCHTVYDVMNGTSFGLSTWNTILWQHDLDGTIDGSGACTTCHDATRDTSASGVYSISPISQTVQTVIAANGNPTNCIHCHRDKIDSVAGANAMHGNDHKGNSNVTGIGTTCVNCHDQNGNDTNTQYITVIHGNCGKCHVSASGGGPLHDYSVTGGNIGDTINYEAVNGGGGGSCADCHVRYNTNFETGHQHEDHSELTDSVSCTTNCHSVNVSILADIHGDTTGCTNCHTDPVTDGTLIVGINHHGSAADHVIGVPSACTDCHGGIYSYDTDFKAHAVKDHTGVEISANCTTTCHTVNIPAEADIILSTHKNVCTNCHFNTTTDGRLKAGTNGTAVTGSGTCAFCHPDYDSNFLTGHDSPDHRNANNTTDMLAVSVAGNCTTTCHNGSSLNAILVNIHGNGTISTCTQCHTNTLTDGTLRGGTNGTADGHLLDTQSTCASCHSAYNTNFSDSINGHKNDTHVAQLTGNVTCVSTICHPGVIIDVVHKLDCTNCHVDPTTNGTLKSGVNGSAAGHTVGGSSACTDCHGGGGVYTYDTNFAIHDVQDHTGIAKSTNCTTTCHTVTSITIINIAAEIISSTHKGTCANCHNNTGNNGTLKAGADGTALLGAGNCAFCHSAYNTDYTTHNVGDHSGVIANASPVGKRDDCTTACHTGNLISAGFGGINPPGTHKNDCFHCHTNGDTNGTLIVGVNNYGDASGHSITTASDCNTCHVPFGYFDSHTHGNLENHDVTMGVSDKSNGSSCNLCHRRGGTTTANPLFTNTWSGTDGIYALHTGSCTFCHDETRTTNMSGGYTGGVQDAITSGTDIINCLHCHNDRSDAHGGHTGLSDAKVSWDATCNHTGCHNSADNVIIDVHKITLTGNDCSLCHKNRTLGGGALIDILESDGNSTAPVPGDAVNGGPCTDCHKVLDKNGADFSGTGLIAFHGLTPDDTERATLVNKTHDHLIKSGGSMALSSDSVPAYWKVSIPAYAGKIATTAPMGLLASDYNCGDCHSNNPAPTNKDFTSKEILWVHMDGGSVGARAGTGDCHTCHSFTNVSDEISAGIVSGADQNCEACHRIDNDDNANGVIMRQYDGIRHHKTTNALSGNCDYCHADPRPSAPVETTGYAYTAAATGDHTDGWETDYLTPDPLHPLPPDGIKDTGGANKMSCSATFCHNNATGDADGNSTGYGVNSVTYTPIDLSSDPAVLPYNDMYDLTGLGAAVPLYSPVHTISHTAQIKISNYGACLSCHSVQIWHGKPDWPSGSDNATRNTDNPFDTLRFAPGKSIWGSTPPPTPGYTQPNTVKFDIFSLDDGSDPALLCVGNEGDNLTGGVTKVRMFYRYTLNVSDDPNTDRDKYWKRPYNGTGSKDRGKTLYKDYRDENCVTPDNPWKETYKYNIDPTGSPSHQIFKRILIPLVHDVNNFDSLMTSAPFVPVFINVQ